jgi:hypothetical protein
VSQLGCTWTMIHVLKIYALLASSGTQVDQPDFAKFFTENSYSRSPAWCESLPGGQLQVSSKFLSTVKKDDALGMTKLI